LLVELDALQKSPEETRPEIVAGRGSAVFVQKPMVLPTTGKPGAVSLIRERFDAASDESKVGTEAEALNTDLK